MIKGGPVTLLHFLVLVAGLMARNHLRNRLIFLLVEQH